MTTFTDHATSCWLNSLSVQAMELALQKGNAILKWRSFWVVAIRHKTEIDVSIWSGHLIQHQSIVPFDTVSLFGRSKESVEGKGTRS